MKHFLKPVTLISLFVLLFALSACVSTPNRESTGQYIDSSTVTTKVKAKLADTLGVRSLTGIHVSTYKGVVQLSGFLKSKDEIKQAVRVSKSVAGVVAVENSLLVKDNLQ